METIKPGVVQRLIELGWYPTSIARACRGETLASLEPATKAALAERLKGKQHGPWLVLKMRLRGGGNSELEQMRGVS
jgi:hypothetical protein